MGRGPELAEAEKRSRWGQERVGAQGRATGDRRTHMVEGGEEDAASVGFTRVGSPGCYHAPVTTDRFTMKLVPHRSTWDVVRLTWAPVLMGLALVIAAKLLEGVSPAASDGVGAVASLVVVAGVLYVGFIWQRGPAVTLEGGVLSLGAARAPVTEVVVTRGEYVFRSQSRFAPGTFWGPLLTLRFPGGQEFRVGSTGAGGGADGRSATPPPHYTLAAAEWDRLAALVGR